MQNVQTTFQGTEINYALHGPNGAPVIMLVHGFGEDGSIWQNQLPVLEPYRVIIPDLPGSGGSAYNEQAMDINEMARLLQHIAVKEQVSRFGLFGHSMGGYIALAYAEQYGERLAALGLVHSTAYADSDEKKATRRKSIAFIQEHGAEKFLAQTIPNLFSKKFVEMQGNVVAEQVKKGAMFAVETLVGYYEAMIRRPNRVNVLKNAVIPVFFAAGVYDEAVPFQHSLEQAHLPDISYIHVLENTAHMGMLEEKVELNKAIAVFLKSTFCA